MTSGAPAKILTPVSVLAALLVFTAFGFGLFFQGYHDIKYAPAVGAMLLMGCLVITPPSLGGKLEIPVALSASLLFAFWVFLTLSLSWSSVPFSSLVTYLVFIVLPLAYFMPLLSPQRESILKLCMAGLMIALAVMALYALCQYFFIEGREYGQRAYLPLANPNSLAGLFSLGLFPCLAATLSSQRGSKLFYAGLAFSLLFTAGILATQSRGAILCDMMVLPLLLFFLRKEQPKFHLSVLAYIVPALLLFALIEFVSYDGATASRIATLAAQGASEDNVQARIAIWSSSWELFKNSPLLGTGFGTFYLYYPSVREAILDNSTGQWAHMDTLQYATELGFIAPLIIYGLLLAITVRTFRTVKTSPERVRIAGLYCAIIALFAHTHLTFHLYIMPTLLVLGIWLSGWYYFCSRSGNDHMFKTVVLEGWQKPFIAFIAVSIAGLIGLMAASSAWGTHHLLLAKERIARADPEGFMREINEAERFAPASFIDAEVHLAGLYIDFLRNPLQLFNEEEQQSLGEQALSMLDYAQMMNPQWAEIDYKRGALFDVLEKDDQQKAMDSWQTAIDKNPMHLKAREKLAQAYLSKGNAAKAYNILADGLRYPVPHEDNERIRDNLAQIKPLADVQRNYKSAPATTTQQDSP